MSHPGKDNRRVLLTQAIPVFGFCSRPQTSKGLGADENLGQVRGLSNPSATEGMPRPVTTPRDEKWDYGPNINMAGL